MAIQHLVSRQISVVVPVKDNQRGIECFLQHFFDNVPSGDLPLEIIIVDDGSKGRLVIPDCNRNASTRIRLIRSPMNRNRAGARNLGVKLAHGDWILFVDSDCIPSANLIGGYLNAYDPRYAAYAGSTYSLATDPLSRFYDSERVFIPPPTPDGKPLYLITANAMVCKEVLVQMNGFDETFFSGEDLDLSFRILSRHRIDYALDSVVHHDMSDGFLGFVERFYRYGKGNRLLEDKYDNPQGEVRREAFKPFQRPAPSFDASFNRLMAFVRYLCELWGYKSCSLRELHTGLGQYCLEGVEEDDAGFLLSALAQEMESFINRGEPGFRDMPVPKIYGFSMLLLSLLGSNLPHLEEAITHRFMALQPSLLR